MSKKFFVFLAAGLFLGLLFAPIPRSEASSDDLAALLPQSDGVIAVDVRRLFDQALPQVLSANEPMLTKVNSEVDKIRARTGLDLRKFDRLAVGIRTSQLENGALDFQPVMLARGESKTSDLAEAAKLASGGKARTEKVAGRTVYIFSSKDIVDRNVKPAAQKKGFFDQAIAKLLTGLSDDIALTAFDPNTVAVGSVERVRELLGESPRLDARILGLLDRDQSTMVRFAMTAPDGLSQFLELEDDELGDSLNSVRDMNGYFDVVPGKASLFVAARTADADQAESLQVFLKGLQGLSGILKSQKGEDKKVYARMLEGLKIGRADTEITISLVVPQSDLDIIVGKG